MSVLDKILKSVENYPDRCAYISLAGSISYRDLWERSGRLASLIEEKAGESKAPVVIYGHKSPQMLVCFLACARSGRAYCPVDKSMPPQRIRDIAAQTGAPLLIAVEPLSYEEPVSVTADELEAAAEAYPQPDPKQAVSGDDIFYMIFTSGSTGRPKGVQITDSNLDSFVSWSCSIFGRPGVFMNQAPYSFDLSVFDTYSSLTMGGTVVSLDKGILQDMEQTFSFLRENGVEFFVSTPSFANLLLADKAFAAEGFPALDRFVFCGEKLTKETASRLRERFPEAKVINTYGPTEATVAVSGVEITDDMLASEKPLPVGAAKPDTEIYTDGEELIISGPSVSPGYYKDREKTDKVFYAGTDGMRCYRTGDSGYYEDGMLYCTGRLDSQIKMSGYRIELEDIENNLLGLDGIGEAAVIPRYDGEIIKSLAAFVAPDESGTALDGRALRKKLKEKLPAYMVPKKIIVTERLPVNDNGKINRKKLEELL